MKIWFINHYATDPRGPGGTRHHALAKELVARGHQVTIVAASFDHAAHTQKIEEPGHRHRGEVVDGIRFLWLRTPSHGSGSISRSRNMLSFARRVRAIRGGGAPPEVIVGSSPHPFAAVAALGLARRVGASFVLEIRDLWPESLVELAGMAPRSPVVLLVDRLVRLLYRRSDGIIGLMPGAAEAIAERGGSPADVTWISNGIDLSLVPRPEPPAPSARFTVMFVGNHGAPQALDDVLDAAHILRDAGRGDLEIRLVGDGAEKLRLVERARAEGLDNVHFEGLVPKAQIFDVMQHADAFIVTMRRSNLYRFGMSFNKLFDYLACARPIVFGCAASNDIVTQAGAGLSVQAEDPRALAEAIVTLADMAPEERAEMGRRGRAFVEAHHSFAHLAATYEVALEKAQRKRRAGEREVGR